MNQVIFEKCHLCSSAETCHFFKDKKRNYLECSSCGLVFVEKQQRLKLEDERKQYDLHQNDINDQNYRNFLSKLLVPVSNIIPAPANVLDFGCGPGPALAQMFREKGYITDIYDPYFFPNESIFIKKYQIITLTEVIEHMFNPLDELIRLKTLLSAGGVIGIMTKRLPEPNKFSSWHYKNDPTHVCFYSNESFMWLAHRLDMDVVFCGEDTVLFRK